MTSPKDGDLLDRWSRPSPKKLLRLVQEFCHTIPPVRSSSNNFILEQERYPQVLFVN
ncbi:MAG: hypothetical protein LH628_24190 [Microcoleus sp. CAN_BIN18]|nr:hypothetical protein [Microcoleus sp. CAN_BIN18]